MKLEIAEQTEEIVNKLELVYKGFGDIVLKVKDKPAGNILSLRSNGTIELHKGVNEDLGFETDGHGRVVIR